VSAEKRRHKPPAAARDGSARPVRVRGDVPCEETPAREPDPAAGVEVESPPPMDPSPDPGRPVAEMLGLTSASEVARAALNRAKAAAKARGVHPGRPSRRRADLSLRSGARPDGRDPVLLGDTLARLAAERGWREELSVGSVIGRWREVVGDDVADHCIPESFDNGLLVVRADSTTWAANLRLLSPQLVARLEADVGVGVVREVKVLGPSGPQWTRGPRRVRGRGPRDTYG
jgi:predicted nucleic acid-binding Zn ribbon protein